MNNGILPEITFKLFVRVLSLIAWGVTYLNTYVIFVYLWWYFFYNNYMRSLSMCICYPFVLHCLSRTIGEDNDIHQQLKAEQFNCSLCTSSFPDGITWTDMCNFPGRFLKDVQFSWRYGEFSSESRLCKTPYWSLQYSLFCWKLQPCIRIRVPKLERKRRGEKFSVF